MANSYLYIYTIYKIFKGVKYKMNEKEFTNWCKKEVCDYTNKHLDKTDNKQITVDDVFVVWNCKTLQKQ